MWFQAPEKMMKVYKYNCIYSATKSHRLMCPAHQQYHCKWQPNTNRVVKFQDNWWKYNVKIDLSVLWATELYCNSCTVRTKNRIIAFSRYTASLCGVTEALSYSVRGLKAVHAPCILRSYMQPACNRLQAAGGRKPFCTHGVDRRLVLVTSMQT